MANEHEGHSVKAMVDQRTNNSLSFEDGEWYPDWNSEAVVACDVDEDTIWCETCNERVET